MADEFDNGGGGEGGESGQSGGNVAQIASRLKGDFDRVFQGESLDRKQDGQSVRDAARGPQQRTNRRANAPAGQRRNYTRPAENDDPELEGVSDDGDQDRASDRKPQRQQTQRTNRQQQQPVGRNQTRQQPADQDDGVGDGAQGDTADDAPTVHPLLRDAASRTGWSDDEIDDHIESVGIDKAERDFQRLFDSLNSVATQFGRLGGAQNNAAGQIIPAGNRSQQQPGAEPVGLLNQLFGDDVDRFDDIYGEGFTDRVIKPLVDNVVQPFQRMQQEMQQERIQALATEVGSFFDSQKDFAKTFGAGQTRTREQAEARWQVGQLADQIRAGAALQGVQVSVKEALDMAMRQFVAPQLQEQMRKRISDQIRKRSSRITARPTQRNSNAPAAGQPGAKNKANAIGAVAQAMDELGIDANG